MPSSWQKAAFVASVAVLAFVGGVLAQKFGWFPATLLDRAVRQGQAVAEREAEHFGEPPDFLEPRRYRRSGARVIEPGSVQPGLTRITVRSRDSVRLPGLELIDRHGEVVHRWRVDPAEHFTLDQFRRGIGIQDQDIHGSHLFPESGDVLVNIPYAGTLRLDACSRVEWKLAEGGHHSIHRASDGSFWIPGLTHPGPAASERHPEGYPDLPDRIYHGRLMNVSPDGELLRELRVLDVLLENGLWDEIELKFRRSDVVHTNDVEPLPDSLAAEYPGFEAGDLLVSLRDPSLVFVVDPDTREVKWHLSEPFRLQHDPDFTGDGWIGVFDNRWDGVEDRRAPEDSSRILAVHTGSGQREELFPGPASEPFFTAHRGKWDRLANGNLLLVEADAGRVVEVAPEDGRTVWEWIAPPFGEDHVPGVANAVRHDLTREDVARWPCSEVDAGG